MATFSKLQRRLVLIKLLQDSRRRRRRKESLQKMLHLLQARRMLLLQVCFPTILLIFFLKTPLLFNPVDDYSDITTDVLNIYGIRTVMRGSRRHDSSPACSSPSRYVFTSVVSSGNIRIIILRKGEFSSLSPCTNAIPPKYIDKIY